MYFSFGTPNMNKSLSLTREVCSTCQKKRKKRKNFYKKKKREKKIKKKENERENKRKKEMKKENSRCEDNFYIFSIGHQWL